MKYNVNMSVNSNLLRYKIRSSNLTQRDISEKLHIFPSLLNMRISGRVKFRDYEVAAIKDILNLSSSEVMDIFYQDVVLSNEGIKQLSVLNELNMYIKLIANAEIIVRDNFKKLEVENILKLFLSNWIRNPSKNVFKFPLSKTDIKMSYRFFALHEILVRKIDKKKSIETHARLFETVRINYQNKTIELKVNNHMLRSL